MKILLSLMVILGLAHSEDPQFFNNGYPVPPLQEVQTTSHPTQSNWRPYALVIVGTPILAYTSVKLGSSSLFQSTGVAQALGSALETLLKCYPNAPRNAIALLVSWGACTTAALFYASGLQLNLSFGKSNNHC